MTIVRPRQTAVSGLSMTHHSLPAIGRHFGNRDHTTVMHAVRRVEELMQQDPDFAQHIAEIR